MNNWNIVKSTVAYGKIAKLELEAKKGVAKLAIDSDESFDIHGPFEGSLSTFVGALIEAKDYAKRVFGG